MLLVAPSLASADTSSTLTIVGTSDVSDSGLIPNVIQPQFTKDFPQYTFKYVGSATGAAIQSAENGTGGPSALIVHAASLENQFVADGFSYNNQYGNAIFTNDFILAGPTGDPAAVGRTPPTTSPRRSPTSRPQGQSRNGHVPVARRDHHRLRVRPSRSTPCGRSSTSSGLQPSSLVLCDVSAADGGGMTPIKSSAQATSASRARTAAP